MARSWICELLARYQVEGEAAFEPRSRRPHSQPRAIPAATVALIIRLRHQLAGQGLDSGSQFAWHLVEQHQLTVSEASNRQPSESDVLHDHVGPREHQIAAVARSVVGIGARYMEHAGTTDGGEAVDSTSCGSELSPGWGSPEMISDGSSDANGKVLVEGVGENQLPTARAWGLWWPGPPIAAPSTGNRHPDLFCHLRPGHALLTKVQDLLGGCGMRRSNGATTHGDAGPLELLADRAPMHAQLRHRSGAGSSPGRTSRLHALRPRRHRDDGAVRPCRIIRYVRPLAK